MSNIPFDHNLIDSILIIKASEQSEIEAKNDLILPSGQSISELLNDKKNIKEIGQTQD